MISENECVQLAAELESSVVGRGRAGARNLMSIENVAALANDVRLLELARALNGRYMVPFKATLFAKTGKRNWLVGWHQDTALPVTEMPDDGWTAPSIKAGTLFAQAPAEVLARVLALRVHLDPSTHLNGPLRVIPGSHRSGILGDKDIGELVMTNEARVCLSPVGGVIAMRPLVLHASSKIVNDDPRRVIHIEYAESLYISEGVRLAMS